jgi:hypothetical protein
MGINKRTFLYWVNGRPRNEDDGDEDESAHGAQTSECSCIPDPGCPVHGEGVNHGSPLEDAHA